MASIRVYTYIYILLLVLAASKFVFFELPQIAYWEAIGLTFVTAVMKTGLIVAYYQHLKYEPRSLTWLMALAAGLVGLLGIAATFSVV